MGREICPTYNIYLYENVFILHSTTYTINNFIKENKSINICVIIILYFLTNYIFVHFKIGILTTLSLESHTKVSKLCILLKIIGNEKKTSKGRADRVGFVREWQIKAFL